MKRPVLLAMSMGFFVPAALAACDEKSIAPAAARIDAGADKYATADPKLTRALLAAESASGSSDNGPPPDGIFGRGVADRRHPKGKPTTIELLGDGSEPRVTLAGNATADAIRAADYGPAALRIVEQRGRMARPTVDFTFAVGPAKKDDGGTDWLVATVKKAVPAPPSVQLGSLPPGMDKVIGSLAGTDLRLKLSSAGGLGDIGIQLGKTSEPELEQLAQTAVEQLALVTIPLPDKPVGVGAQWIAESRMPLEGLDVVTYRAFRVKTITGNRVHLSVDAKAYAADKTASVQGIPRDAVFAQFDAVSQGEMEMVCGESLARVADLQQTVVMIFQAPAAAQPPMESPQGPGGPPPTPQMGVLPLQIKIQATLARGEDLRAASAKP